MTISSIKDYLSSMSVLASSLVQQTQGSASQAEEAADALGQDSYISSVEEEGTVYPCENYNDILQVIAENKAASSGTSTEEEGGGFEETSEAAAEGSAAASGGGGSEGEEETSTEIITIGGVTYLQTSTVENGITTVTRTVLNEAGAADGAQEAGVQAIVE